MMHFFKNKDYPEKDVATLWQGTRFRYKSSLSYLYTTSKTEVQKSLVKMR